MAINDAACCRRVPGSTFGTCHFARLRFKLQYPAAAAVVLATALAAPVANRVGAVIEAPAMVALQSRQFSYRLPGEFTQDGKPLIAPQRIAQLDRTLTIMVHQVTVADYERCVRDRA